MGKFAEGSTTSLFSALDTFSGSFLFGSVLELAFGSLNLN